MATPSLSTEQIGRIERLIDLWLGKLTWAKLVDTIADELNIKTTRQTLNKYISIKRAYDRAKVRLRTSGEINQEMLAFTKQDVDQFERIKRKDLEIARLTRRCDTQLAFIKAIVAEASTNPLLHEALERVKSKVTSAQNSRSTERAGE